MCVRHKSIENTDAKGSYLSQKQNQLGQIFVGFVWLVFEDLKRGLVVTELLKELHMWAGEGRGGVRVIICVLPSHGVNVVYH